MQRIKEIVGIVELVMVNSDSDYAVVTSGSNVS